MPTSSARKIRSLPLETNGSQGHQPVLGSAEHLQPYWSAPAATLYLGDARMCLRRLPAQSAHCVVTSPPYWELRDYRTGTWEGGSAGCDHIERTAEMAHRTSTLGPTAKQRARGDFSRVLPSDNAAFEACVRQFTKVCRKCGAQRSDAQIGVEPCPDCGTNGQAQCGACYICSLVAVFRDIHRVLRDDGTCWLNLGDTFDNGQLLIPARVALALVVDGWKLVQDIIWYSPNKMPESVTSRCTRSHEHIFLLAKTTNYYYDSVVIEERTSPKTDGHNDSPGSKNKRDVWVVPTRGYSGTHRASFSPQLITPCILAGTSERGCCSMCGTPYKRVIARIRGKSGPDTNDSNASRDRSFEWSRNGKPGSNSTLDGVPAIKETVGWQKTCGCQTRDVVPCMVLDPFVGSGTTVATALSLGRAGIGIDLSEAYLRQDAIPRIEASHTIARPATKDVDPGVPLSPERLRGGNS